MEIQAGFETGLVSPSSNCVQLSFRSHDSFANEKHKLQKCQDSWYLLTTQFFVVFIMMWLHRRCAESRHVHMTDGMAERVRLLAS